MTNDEPRTITAAAELVRRGDLTPSDLLEQCIARIDRYEERVKAWVYLDRERARTDAARLTDELKAGQNRGPLHGIPVGIKDIINVFDMPTGCGSKLWANSYARRDATCVERLRQAGAVILGKTVTTPFAYLDPPPTRNPWNPDRTPGGSSSGSAAAVACGMCLAALGTQTGGSLTRPASYCGVYSLKPTHGRVSVTGVLPLAPSLDHVGVMANCVRDLALIFHVVAGPDGPGGQPGPTPDAIFQIEDDLHESDAEPHFSLNRLRGLFEDRLETQMRDAMYSANSPVWGLGMYAPTPVIPPAGFGEIIPAHRTVMTVEAATYHAERFRRCPEDYPPRLMQLIQEGISTQASCYRRALDLQCALGSTINNMLFANREVFLTPATTGAAPPPDTTGDPVFNSPWSFCGMPTVSFPMAWTTEGLPLSLQLVSWKWSEAQLLGIAAACERIVGFKPRPLPL